MTSTEDDSATAPHEHAELDCLSCGACCAPASNWRTYVEVTDAERARLPGKYFLLVIDGELATRRRKGGIRCVALRGVLGESVRCDIHALRPSACRAFTAGSPPCLEARAEVLRANDGE